MFSLRKTNLSHEAGSICSYAIKSQLPTILLYQQETGFSLALEVQKIKNVLWVTRFTLTDNPQLANASRDLYDAVRIEIVLQALAGLFAYAQRHKLSEILLILPEEDALQISCFEGLFEEASPLVAEEKKRVILRLSCAFQDLFFKQITTIKTQLKRELWKAQRNDSYLQNYLQFHERGILLSFDTPIQQEIENNIVPFPKSFNS